MPFKRQARGQFAENASVVRTLFFFSLFRFVEYIFFNLTKASLFLPSLYPIFHVISVPSHSLTLLLSIFPHPFLFCVYFHCLFSMPFSSFLIPIVVPIHTIHSSLPHWFTFCPIHCLSSPICSSFPPFISSFPQLMPISSIYSLSTINRPVFQLFMQCHFIPIFALIMPSFEILIFLSSCFKSCHLFSSHATCAVIMPFSL